MKCLGCGIETNKGNRRILKNTPAIYSFWSQLLISEISEHVPFEESRVYMCLKCHHKYTKLLALYEDLRSSLHDATIDATDTQTRKRALFPDCGSNTNVKKLPKIVHSIACDESTSHRRQTVTVRSYNNNFYNNNNIII